MAVHRGKYPNIQSRFVESEDEEQEALAHGWSANAPIVPAPEEITTPLTVEERLVALEGTVSRLFEMVTAPSKGGKK
jgi:hypothetical protein